MAYEVWIFEQRPTGVSRLKEISIPPPGYSHTDVTRWAEQIERDHAHEGTGITTVIRNEASY